MLRIIQVCIMIALSVFISWIVGHTIAEKFFFDKVFYGKSHEFGYLAREDYQNYDLLKSRVNGLDTILYADYHPSGSIKKDAYTIAVIGDSYVWGEGIRASDRFAVKLQKKLDAIRKTEIYSYALPGDNFADNLSKYFLIRDQGGVDLYIFILVFNDIFLQTGERYPSSHTKKILKDCDSGSYIYDTVTPTWDAYLTRMRSAWKNESNLCILSAGATHLPKNAMYVILDRNWEYSSMKDGYETYIKILSDQHLRTLHISQDSPGIESYAQYWGGSESDFHVSLTEGHPSSLANQMFADYFYNLLTHDKTWGFIQKPK